MLSYLRAPFFLGLAFYELYLVLTLGKTETAHPQPH
jgi:hypothetical protein